MLYFSVVFLFVLAERSIKHTASVDTDGDVDRTNQSGLVLSPREESNAPKRSPENVSHGGSCLSSSAASEGEGVCEAKGGFSRPCSENYLTASDDSSSLFDDDMQRAERPVFGLVEMSEAVGEEVGRSTTKLEDCTSEELNKRFQSQRLDSSSSSSEPTTPSPILTPAPTPKRPNAPMDNPASPKQPRLRTPAGGGLLSVSVVKKHLSQPPVGSEAAHSQTRNALSMLRPLQSQENDLDQQLEDDMETGRITPPSSASSESRSERTDCDSSGPCKPPTPPLHRLPSWVRKIN